MYFLVFFIHLCRKSLSKALLTASFRGVSVRRFPPENATVSVGHRKRMNCPVLPIELPGSMGSIFRGFRSGCRPDFNGSPGVLYFLYLTAASSMGRPAL